METRLLVSVRNVSEAKIALAGGTDLIDVKEPSRGALGAAAPAAWDAIVDCLADRVPLSAALGELLDPEFAGRVTRCGGMNYAKIGLAGCLGRADWQLSFRQAVASFPASTGAVAVIYADRAAAQSPESEEIVALASDAGCRGIVVDTFDKSGGNLLDHWSLKTISQLLDHCRRRELITVLAGSLDAAAIRRLRLLAPNYFGVRGAACAGGRAGTIDLARVKSLAHVVHHARQKQVADSA